MFFLGKKPKPETAAGSTKARGQAAEDQALAYLQARGLRLLGRNYRTPGRGGGEIDLILQESDGTVVFVEVRSRSHSDFGGAGASIGHAKRQRIVFAARQWLHGQGWQEPCRFDVVLMQGAQLHWLPAAFDAG
ncbi:MAG: YraN family protein [Comamonas sp.]|nr:YraN family protein [Comamonas sp.]